MTLRTIVVDDSIIFRKIMRDALSEIPGVDVVDIARDGIHAVEKITSQKPDLVTLDIEMPGLNGLEVLEELELRGIQTNILVVSAHTPRGAETTTQALSMGALDFILKPIGGDSIANAEQLRSELRRLIGMVKNQNSGVATRLAPPKPVVAWKSTNHIGEHCQVPVKLSPAVALGAPPTHVLPPGLLTPKFPKRCQAIFLGISTGGPKALASFIPKIPSHFDIPIILVQHMPPLFTGTMAKSLDASSTLNVVEATDGMPMVGGGVYIAPGGKHLAVKTDVRGTLIAKVTDDAPVKSCKPSVDYMMMSVAPDIAQNSLAVIMTGMGDDGKEGCAQMRKHGCTVWAQSAPSCTVYGMPRQVIENNLADFAFDLKDLPNLLAQLTRRSGNPAAAPTFAGSITQAVKLAV